jgi:hypothetical protein
MQIKTRWIRLLCLALIESVVFAAPLCALNTAEPSSTLLVAEQELSPLIVVSGETLTFRLLSDRKRSYAPVRVELVQYTSGLASPIGIGTKEHILKEGTFSITLPTVERESYFLIKALIREGDGASHTIATRRVIALPSKDIKALYEEVELKGIIFDPKGTGGSPRLTDILFKLKGNLNKVTE